ncbi:hypothetical protein CC79DRAFT_854132 [Sarocladium strictum]
MLYRGGSRVSKVGKKYRWTKSSRAIWTDVDVPCRCRVSVELHRDLRYLSCLKLLMSGFRSRFGPWASDFHSNAISNLTLRLLYILPAIAFSCPCVKHRDPRHASIPAPQLRVRDLWLSRLFPLHLVGSPSIGFALLTECLPAYLCGRMNETKSTVGRQRRGRPFHCAETATGGAGRTAWRPINKHDRH